MKAPFLHRAAVDWPIVVGVIVTVCLYSFHGFPATRKGFVCGDKSLSYPFLDSTVSSALMYSLSVLLPVAVLVLVELIVKRESVEFYDKFLRFGFGAAFSQLVVDFGKYYTGELRPHFLTVCDPRDPFNTSMPLDCEPGKYVSAYVCRPGSELYADEARLSFPSSHAAFSFYAAVFLALYIRFDLPGAKGYVVRSRWRRWNWWRVLEGAVLVRPLLQAVVLTMALFASVSRVVDFKHHPEDVLMSSVIGAVVAVVVYFSSWSPKSSSLQDFGEVLQKSQSCHFHWHYNELVC